MFGFPGSKGGDGAEDPRERERRRARRSGRMPASVKTLIGFDSMLRNGIAYLGDDRWSASMSFTDINYQLAPERHQMEIIDHWAKMLTGLEGGQDIQIGLYTRTRGLDDVLRDIRMADRGDGLDRWRHDYNDLVGSKLEAASRNTETVKVLTLTVEEHDRDMAVNTLNGLCNSVAAQLNAIDGCRATRLTREQRLALMSEILRPGEDLRFNERTFRHLQGRPDVKDLVCPWMIDASRASTLRVESLDSGFWHRTLWISGLPPELSDQLINELTGLRARVNVSVHLAPYDRGDSMTMVRRKGAEIKMQVMETRRQNRRQGLDPDDLPDDLADQQTQIGDLRDELRRTNQRLVNAMIVIGVSADSEEELEHAVKQVRTRVNAQACKAESLSYMQIEGLVAELPLGNNPLPMRRTLTTNSSAILIPFTTQEVYEPRGIFYGANTKTGNPIVADRRAHMNSNGFILGTSGGGKSFSVKQEIGSMFLNRDDDVIIIDPEREYLALCHAFGGQIVEISAGGHQCINPLDIVLDETGDVDPMKTKTNNLVSMIGSLVGGNTGLTAVEKSLVDRSALGLYVRWRDSGSPLQPTLGDLRDALEATGEDAGHLLAVSLDAYTSGSLSGFSGQTNVNLDNRMTVFDVSALTGELRTFGMMVIIDQVWNRVLRNRAAGRRTWLYVDEFHRFFSNGYASSQFLDIYKRARKYGLGVTGITQNIEELLMDDGARLMLSNSDFLMLLTQNASDADELCSLLKLSDEQRSYFTNVMPGQGLMKIGPAYVPFDGRIRDDSLLYGLYTTSFDDREAAR
ncbi:transfer complex protein [Bifidobacterium tissieri]|uniref:Transfer complex protein n=1 Tax=Bifidobacterium tissieri TaxID=1630162 RepID=A0A261FKJ6_9BIFI|nr:transfer complex protein [Bifidobacterium tissieri]